MLAFNGYLHSWQLPLILIFFVGWLAGGGFLFQKTLARQTEDRRFTLGRGILVSFLSGTVGGIVAALFFYIGIKLQGGTGGVILGAILGLVAFLPLAYMVVFAMFKISPGRILAACVLPLGATIVLAGIIGAVCGVPAYYIRIDQLAQSRIINQTMEDFQAIHYALFQDRSKMPDSLDALLTRKTFTDPNRLKSPADSTGKQGYFYHKPDRHPSSSDEAAQMILICDFSGVHKNGQRVVLYYSGKSEALAPGQFEDLLRQPINENFAQTLRKAEEK
ncbi:MAG: TMEM198/TM7SF3 family protein [Phycisphaerae bacterium]|nr:TMEM198/TM7SF3 family protein [Phycisphaerae bacterium]